MALTQSGGGNSGRRLLTEEEMLAILKQFKSLEKSAFQNSLLKLLIKKLETVLKNGKRLTNEERKDIGVIWLTAIRNPNEPTTL